MRRSPTEGLRQHGPIPRVNDVVIVNDPIHSFYVPRRVPVAIIIQNPYREHGSAFRDTERGTRRRSSAVRSVAVHICWVIVTINETPPRTQTVPEILVCGDARVHHVDGNPSSVDLRSGPIIGQRERSVQRQLPLIHSV